MFRATNCILHSYQTIESLMRINKNILKIEIPFYTIIQPNQSLQNIKFSIENDKIVLTGKIVSLYKEDPPPY